ncbi:MAG TPA: hypothetical protein VGC58_00920 [Candidatus Paceibacterota bacterium]
MIKNDEKYSQELIKETINCFKEENAIFLSETEAIEILNNLSALYIAFSKKYDFNRKM